MNSFPKLKVGMLVQVVKKEDQGTFESMLIDKVGLVVGDSLQTSTKSAVWDVMIEGKVFYIHAMDLKEV